MIQWWQWINETFLQRIKYNEKWNVYSCLNIEIVLGIKILRVLDINVKKSKWNVYSFLNIEIFQGSFRFKY